MGFIDDDAWQEQNKARRATANLAVVAKEREKFATGKEVAALRKRIRVLIDDRLRTLATRIADTYNGVYCAYDGACIGDWGSQSIQRVSCKSKLSGGAEEWVRYYQQSLLDDAKALRAFDYGCATDDELRALASLEQLINVLFAIPMNLFDVYAAFAKADPCDPRWRNGLSKRSRLQSSVFLALQMDCMLTNELQVRRNACALTGSLSEQYRDFGYRMLMRLSYEKKGLDRLPTGGAAIDDLAAQLYGITRVDNSSVRDRRLEALKMAAELADAWVAACPHSADARRHQSSITAAIDQRQGILEPAAEKAVRDYARALEEDRKRRREEEAETERRRRRERVELEQQRRRDGEGGAEGGVRADRALRACQ